MIPKMIISAEISICGSSDRGFLVYFWIPTILSKIFEWTHLTKRVKPIQFFFLCGFVFPLPRSDPRFQVSMKLNCICCFFLQQIVENSNIATHNPIKVQIILSLKDIFGESIILTQNRRLVRNSEWGSHNLFFWEI